MKNELRFLLRIVRTDETISERQFPARSKAIAFARGADCNPAVKAWAVYDLYEMTGGHSAKLLAGFSR